MAFPIVSFVVTAARSTLGCGFAFTFFRGVGIEVGAIISKQSGSWLTKLQIKLRHVDIDETYGRIS